MSPEQRHPEAVTPHIANLARAVGFRWAQSGKLRQDEYTRGALHRWLREEHHLDICFRPEYESGVRTYHAYIITAPYGDGAWTGCDFPTLEIALEHAFEAALKLIKP